VPGPPTEARAVWPPPGHGTKPQYWRAARTHRPDGLTGRAGRRRRPDKTVHALVDPLADARGSGRGAAAQSGPSPRAPRLHGQSPASADRSAVAGGRIPATSRASFAKRSAARGSHGRGPPATSTEPTTPGERPPVSATRLTPPSPSVDSAFAQGE
jgi:hypothetical protein